MTGSLFEREAEKIDQPETYRLISLTRGQFAKVDAADYDAFSQYHWTASWDRCPKSFYALRHSKTVDGKRYRISMHRDILGLERGNPTKGDHINGDTLDNQRGNLRIADRAQNRRNSKLNADNTSGYRGVCLHKGRWEAKISVDGRQKHLGSRTSAHDAYHELYLPAVAQYYGDFVGRE